MVERLPVSMELGGHLVPPGLKLVSNNHDVTVNFIQACNLNCKTMIVSIITVVKNDPVGLLRTLESVRKQTYSNYELIVIDGKSTKETIDVIHSNQDIISNWISENDSGIYDAMNKGLNLAAGDIIHFLNAGDYYLSENTLSVVVSVFKQSRYDMIWGDVLMFNNKILQATIRSGNVLWPYYLFKGIPQQAYFYRNTIFGNNRFDLEKKIASDFDLHLNLMWNQKINYKYVNKLFVFFETGGASSRMDQLFIERQSILSQYFSIWKLKILQCKYFYSLFTKNEPIRKISKVENFFVFVLRIFFNIRPNGSP